MTQDPIRTRPDGSIDTAYYMARGRNARSQSAHEMSRGITMAIRILARKIATKSRHTPKTALHPAE